MNWAICYLNRLLLWSWSSWVEQFGCVFFLTWKAVVTPFIFGWHSHGMYFPFVYFQFFYMLWIDISFVESIQLDFAFFVHSEKLFKLEHAVSLHLTYWFIVFYKHWCARHCPSTDTFHPHINWHINSLLKMRKPRSQEVKELVQSLR